MQPIAEAIDFLQRVQNMFFDYFIPTLLSIKIIMRRLASENMKYLTETNIQMQSKLMQRFEKYFSLHSDSWDAVIAAILIPDIKLKFCKTVLEVLIYTLEDVRDKFKEYAMEFKRQPVGEDNNLQPSISANTSFLEFDEESTDENRYTCCHVGVITFIST
ncbi:uncharacterized protein LOC118744738 [Rhagoletis pomonella]|uniref:uncharacterized protein LOC118744738 n=1 Tax=Rhagoletis pomonella TaxID=28610 RepID=UPI00177F5BC2|nr:uncharacterized protein LOC118744738 [Rhagoletis pomonella]